eukprot:TRINITY_DN35238_c0_g1_i1.p1 TRINITY_DN35238_c0_g1~~TRINITY_DN35238_c0_g1_i1.p1  ORF type:complete len:438 (-),score=133.23 TRINITY_DN35238_c0_g1_i1:182-1495(-)
MEPIRRGPSAIASAPLRAQPAAGSARGMQQQSSAASLDAALHSAALSMSRQQQVSLPSQGVADRRRHLSVQRQSAQDSSAGGNGGVPTIIVRHASGSSQLQEATAELQGRGKHAEEQAAFDEALAREEAAKQKGTTTMASMPAKQPSATSLGIVAAAAAAANDQASSTLAQSLAKVLESVSDMREGLRESVTQLQTAVGWLDQRVSSMEGDMAALRSQLGGGQEKMFHRLEEVVGNVMSFQGAIADCRSELQGSKKDFEQCRQKITSLSDLVPQSDSVMDQIASDIGRMQQDFDDFQKHINNVLNRSTAESRLACDMCKQSRTDLERLDAQLTGLHSAVQQTNNDMILLRKTPSTSTALHSPQGFSQQPSPQLSFEGRGSTRTLLQQAPAVAELPVPMVVNQPQAGLGVPQRVSLPSRVSFSPPRSSTARSILSRVS